ncbi:hypothetical protein GWA97_10770 [Flavobacterium sp. LaA7.5]|nr:hypothetical protein [Flavobacterium salilacus subsp. altitudinum]
MRCLPCFLLLLFASFTFYGQELITSEGFFTNREASKVTFFEIRDEGGYPLHPIFDVNISNDSLNTIIKKENKVKVEYIKSSEVFLDYGILPYEQIIIKEIIPVIPEYSFWQYRYRDSKVLEIREPVVAEGFLSKGFEYHTFKEMRNDTLVKTKACLFFDETFKGVDSLYLTDGRMYANLFIKVKGIRKHGPLQYCNRTGSGYAIQVEEVLEVDTTYTLHDFYIEDYRKKGYYLNWLGDTLKAPEDFKIGKTYIFKGTEYIYDDEEVLDSTSVQYSIKAKEDFTEDEIIRYSVEVEFIDAVTIKITVTRLDNKKESKSIILTSAFGGYRGEYESSYISKEVYYWSGEPVCFLSIYTDVKEKGKRLGEFYFVYDDWKSVMDIIEQ